MSKLRKYLKIETDVEIFACAHITAMIFMYGFLLWLTGVKELSFGIIFEQMVLGYIMSWVQKALFLQEKPYKKREYRMREILWCMLPSALLIFAGSLLSWFQGKSPWIAVIFYAVMTCYFIMLWLFLEKFYRKETEELNCLLKQRRKGREKHYESGY